MNSFFPSLHQQQFLRMILHEGPLSRAQLCTRTGIRKMTVYAEADALVEAGLLCDGPIRHLPRGRPEVPLDMDLTKRHVIGLSMERTGAELVRLNLRGQVMGQPLRRTSSTPQGIVEAATKLLQDHVSNKSLAIGFCVPGFIDPETHTVLLSSAMPGQHAVSLAPLYKAAGKVPITLENDLHALAAHWLLEAPRERTEDVLLVYMDDGQIGAGLLINGIPNQGCVTGANEVGHTRLAVETAPCYCGHSGCLERIFSTEFLHGLNARKVTLAETITSYDGRDEALDKILRLVAIGLANAVNFVRPARLVLVSPLLRHVAFADMLTAALRREMLSELARRVKIDIWEYTLRRMAANSGWLALASLFLDDWHSEADKPARQHLAEQRLLRTAKS